MNYLNLNPISNRYTHDELMDGIYFDDWGIPLIRTCDYIDRLWRINYSDCYDLDEFEFTERELDRIYRFAQYEAENIDEDYIYDVLGNMRNYNLIIRRIERYLKVEPKLAYETSANRLVDSKERGEIIDKGGELMGVFIQHFGKIYNNPTSRDVIKWIGEMQAWVDKIAKYKLAGSNKPVSNEQLSEWLFGVKKGHLLNKVEIDNNQVSLYIEFSKSCSANRDVKASIDKVFSEAGIYVNFSGGYKY